MRLVLNNFKALCIFGVLGIPVFLIVLTISLFSGLSVPLLFSTVGRIIAVVIFALSFIGYFVLHFLARRRYMHSTGNLRSDASSYIAISTLALICVSQMFFPFKILFSASYYLSGIIEFMGVEDPLRLSFLIVAVLSILTQILGMLSKRNIDEKSPQTPM